MFFKRKFQLAAVVGILAIVNASQPSEAQAKFPCNGVCVDNCPGDLGTWCTQRNCSFNAPSCTLQPCSEWPGQPPVHFMVDCEPF